MSTVWHEHRVVAGHRRPGPHRSGDLRDRAGLGRAVRGRGGERHPDYRLRWQLDTVQGFVTRRLQTSGQLYRLLSATGEGFRVRYTGEHRDVTAVLTVDPNGVVIDYPGLAHRIVPPVEGHD
ncbi:putative glycolipid-binding domain-containing protein [Nakamurella lactea]|uniref:putative glycolipid-binding domain-containing protein n=1 Tax=Nakamurella lactea TaxID=459515 RepID=UPI000409A332|nr:putative glycolipid-binding domain-containing protein [Nakamurella lactea]